LIKPVSQFKDREYLGIRPEHVHGLFSSEVRHYPHKLLMFSPVTFLDGEGCELHRLLRAIDLNTILSKLTPEDTAKKTELLHPPAVLEDFYKLYSKIIENTRRLAESCEVDLETGLHVNRQTFTGSKEGDFKLLEKLTLEGYKRRYQSPVTSHQSALPKGASNHQTLILKYVLISEKPIFYHTALQMMPKGFPISHFEMHHAEDLGFHKFDVLSQRGVGHIKDTVNLIKMNQGKAVDVHDIPTIKQDERVRAQLRNCAAGTASAASTWKAPP
jgi:DNA polymerase III alpha subunit